MTSAARLDDAPTTVVVARVRDRLRAQSADPTKDPDAAARIAADEVRRHNDYALARGLATIDDESGAVRDVVAQVTGYGPLQAYLDDPGVEELWINAPDRVYVARGGAPERVPLHLTDTAVRDLVERMLHATGRRVDLSQPFVDASLPDGSRLHVVIPDITRRHWAVNIRKFLPAYRDLDALVEVGSLAAPAADLLRRAMGEGRSVLVSGATHAGKTTLLGALVAASPRAHRIVTVEETFELAVSAPDLVAMQGRQPSLEGTGEVTLRRLVKEALRMRPDRIVVGEVRDAEALDLLLALNTGVPGIAIHTFNDPDSLSSAQVDLRATLLSCDQEFCVSMSPRCRDGRGRRKGGQMDHRTVAAELVERAEGDAKGLRVAALAWAGRLRTAGEVAESAEALELADSVEDAVAESGVYGLTDLLLAGRSLGGMSDEDMRALFALADARATRKLAHAA